MSDFVEASMNKKVQRAIVAEDWMHKVECGVLSVAFFAVVIRVLCKNRSLFVFGISSSLMVANILGYIQPKLYSVMTLSFWSAPYAALYPSVLFVESVCYNMAYWTFGYRYLMISLKFEAFVSCKEKRKYRDAVMCIIFWFGTLVILSGSVAYNFTYYRANKFNQC